jgi:hypothetical protein
MPDLSADGFDKAILQRFVEQASIEVAVIADRAAERDVDVEPRDWRPRD